MLLNGKEMKFEPNVTILEVLKELKLNPDVVVIEVNFQIIPNENFPTWILDEGDRVEIVSFIGGG